MAQHIEFGIKPYQTSQYQHYLFDLCVTEFVPFKASWDPQYGVEGLLQQESRRRRGLMQATCQRIAHKMYLFKTLSQTTANQGNPLPPPMTRQVVPWLSRDYAKNEMPYYLWDAIEEKTVITDKLPDKPQYCCISHTWGRWRTKDILRIPGLPWWKVPGNKIFLVERLPEIMKVFADRMKTKYVWFDLLCIPQQDSKPEIALRAKQEIGRQALIFQNAKHCAIWLNYIDDWEAERAALDYVSAVYLCLATLEGQYRHVLREWLKESIKAAEYPVQLAHHPYHKKYLQPHRKSLFKRIGNIFSPETSKPNEGDETWIDPEDWDKVSVWFSSLWTLQEASLRPDMILMNRQWEPLTNSAGDVFSLEMLFMSVEMLSRLTNITALDQSSQTKSAILQRIGTKDRQFPMGVSQLKNLVFGTQLLSNTTRVHVLIQANARQCTGRRAEAIMSVLGTTDWYQNSQTSAADPAEKDLVIGMYPLAFVQEVMCKAGPDFFLAQKRVGDPQAAYSYFDGSAHGSMLPFETLDPQRLCGKADVKKYPYQALDDHVHPCVNSWMLSSTGSFRIAQAAILASSEDGRPAIVPVDVFLSYQTLAGELTHTDRTDIKRWLMDQPDQFVTYAVQISRDLGLIFQGFRDHLRRDQSPLKLVKVGCYQVFDLLEERPEDALTDDDWISHQPDDWVPARDVCWMIL